MRKYKRFAKIIEEKKNKVEKIIESLECNKTTASRCLKLKYTNEEERKRMAQYFYR